MKIYRFLALACLLTTASLAFAQTNLDSYIELLRSDLQTQKKVLITEALQFTDEEAKAFWPMYREYEMDGSKLMVRRVAGLKDYAANYETMTDKKAEELILGSFDLQQDRISLREKYYKKAAKLIGVKKAALWAQVENQIQHLIDAKISAELPLLNVR